MFEVWIIAQIVKIKIIEKLYKKKMRKLISHQFLILTFLLVSSSATTPKVGKGTPQAKIDGNFIIKWLV